MSTLTLFPGREKHPLNRHPWIFSGAVKSLSPEARAGECVRIETAKGGFVGWGLLASETSAIVARILSWDEGAYPDEAWFKETLKRALSLRAGMFETGFNESARLVFSESDHLPGLIVDRFGGTLVLQASTPGMDERKKMIAALLLELLPDCERVCEKSDSDGRKLEKMASSSGLLAGTPPPSEMVFMENGLKYRLGLESQKTGFYTDQRENRARVAKWVHPGMKILDACCFSGGFTLNLLRAGAVHATLVDVSAAALELAKSNLSLNGFHEEQIEFHEDSVFDALRQLKKAGRTFDLIVLDPPKLVRSVKQAEAAVASYKDLNFQALQLLKPGGILATFSCSGNLDLETFRLMVSFASKDANRPVQLLETLFQGADHPVLTSVPESAYLKGFIARVL